MEAEYAWKRSFDLLASHLCEFHGWTPRRIRAYAELDLIDGSTE